jgi:hypothetical protein
MSVGQNLILPFIRANPRPSVAKNFLTSLAAANPFPHQFPRGTFAGIAMLGIQTAVERGQIGLKLLASGSGPYMVRREKFFRLPTRRMTEHLSHLGAGKSSAPVAFDSQILKRGLRQILSCIAQNRRRIVGELKGNGHERNLSATGGSGKGRMIPSPKRIWTSQRFPIGRVRWPSGPLQFSERVRTAEPAVPTMGGE